MPKLLLHIDQMHILLGTGNDHACFVKTALYSLGDIFLETELLATSVTSSNPIRKATMLCR